MTKKKDIELSTTNEGLDELLKDALEGIKEDLAEATENVELYKEKLLNNPLGIDQYGTSHSDALRIKGQARDRYLKLIALVKDQVKSKEIMKINVGSGAGLWSPEALNAALSELNIDSLRNDQTDE